ncbi:Putative ribonuclease H protein At1g65750 [Linum perenne]
MGRGEDTWSWGEEPNGKLSIRTAYCLILDLNNQSSVLNWKCVWSWRGPSRIQYFLWLVLQNKLLTNAERKRRHLTDNNSCPRCNSHEESVSHVLRDCQFAANVWSALNLHVACPIQNSAEEWIMAGFKHPQNMLFGIGCWYLWKARNDLIFSANLQNPNAVAAKALSWNHTVAATLTQDKSLSQTPPSRVATEIVWDPGPDGWVTLNTDGSVNHSTGIATAGGLLRNHLGHCAAAFSANLGKCSITRAELRGILHGLDIAWKENHKQVRVQTDSMTAVKLILADDVPLHQHASEVLAIRDLLQRNWQTEVLHIYREANGAADYLASKGYSLDPGVHSFSISDCNLGYYLRKDFMLIAELRSISMRI